MQRFVGGLWRLYGYTYDGLKHFYPYRQLLALVHERLAPERNDRILDLGCGTGNMLELIQPSHAQLIGIDRSKSMIAAADRKLNRSGEYPPVSLVCGDILAFLRTQDDSSFDKVVSVNVIYALDNRDLVWRELRRILKPGGIMVIATSVKTGSGGIIAEHLAHASWVSLLNPRLLGVFAIDSLINVLGDTGHFAFPGREILAPELARIHCHMSDVVVCYGGVDILFTVRPD